MHLQDQIKCPGCSTILAERDFRPHIKSCSQYPGFALTKIRKISPHVPQLQLKMIITQLDLCREFIEDMIHQSYQKQKNNHRSNNRGSYMEEEPPQIDLVAFNQDIVSCNKCNRKFYASFETQSLFYVEDCFHLFCKSCIVKHFDQEFVNKFGNLPCPSIDCSKNIPQYQLEQLVGKKRFETQQQKGIKKMYSEMYNLIECVKCKEQFDFVSGKPSDAPPKDNNGKPLTEEHKKHYAENRFHCTNPGCKAEQCKSCQAVPYHLGMSCKAFQQRSQMKKCRYCDEPITEKNKPRTKVEALSDICTNKECSELAKRTCPKMLPCRHPCGGVNGESECLPCLREPCCQENDQLNGQNGDDYCNICFIEALNAGPCVRSTCGHIFHEKCLAKRYEIKWLTPRILFNFCLCPLCKKWVYLSEENPLTPAIKANLDLYSKIQTMAFDRLKFEECLKDQKLTDPGSPYYNKPNQYAMAIYAYFLCFKCKKPYFGGRKNCAQAMNQPQNQGQFKPEQLVCPNCCEIPSQNCPKHGKDFIEFKCKFCCSTAQWFCWGNTHFCEPCHKRQCNGDYVSKYTKDKLPKCPGGKSCPIGGDHGGNGEQKSLGCAICRNYKQNSKNF